MMVIFGEQDLDLYKIRLKISKKRTVILVQICGFQLILILLHTYTGMCKR